MIDIMRDGPQNLHPEEALSRSSPLLFFPGMVELFDIAEKAVVFVSVDQPA